MDWNDVSLNKFNEIKELILDTELDDEERVMYQIQVLFGVDPNRITIPELRGYVKEMGFLSKPIPKMRLKDTYNLGSNKYVLRKRLEDFTVAQWMDWQAFIKENNGSENYPKLLSVFLFPEGHDDYNEGYNIENVREDIGNYMSIPDAMAVSSFFLKCHRRLLTRFLLSTLRKTLQTATPLKWKERMKIRMIYWRQIGELISGDSSR